MTRDELINRRIQVHASWFWSKVDRRAEDECWPWTGALRGLGYGQFSIGNDLPTIGAHRVAYHLVKGPIPDGLTIDHLCGNPACCNPAHLEAVTMRENILRGNGIGARNARKTHCKNGHPFDGDNLVVRNGRRCCVTCSPWLTEVAS